ncbi:hypothetical protein Ancab_019413 [Ancistrocladus abbreviatus]
MLKLLNKNLRRLCAKLRRKFHPRSPSSKHKTTMGRHGNSNSIDPNNDNFHGNGSATIYSKPGKPIRIATFNAALFSMAPAVPTSSDFHPVDYNLFSSFREKSTTDRPKSILKQSPLHPGTPEVLTKQQRFARSRLRVSINLPDNEISLGRSRRLDEIEVVQGNGEKDGLRSAASFPAKVGNGFSGEGANSILSSNRTVFDVLREVDADILALQDVKAEEERDMKPLSELASALGMNYVFAESWAPEYGNAVLSRWPIRRWKVQKIFDDTDFRNVLKTTIDVPQVGEVNFYCTLLDHLDEDWRMKQVDAIIQASDCPHILAGGLNSLDETDYSQERWTDILKYYEDIGKPMPKAEVMRFLKSKQYTDAKDFAGECESVVMIAKGQNVQGTCKYGTRVDYVLASPGSTYKFVPGSYSVHSSKGTSDHHIVKVDMVKVESIQEIVTKKRQQEERQPNRRVVKVTTNSSTKGMWRTGMTWLYRA